MNAKHMPDPAKKNNNETPSIYIAGDVNGNITFGEGNAIKNETVERGSPDPRPTPGPHPSLRSELAGFVPGTISGRLTIFLIVLAAISVCAAIFVTILGFQPLMHWFKSILTATPAWATSAPLTPTLTLTPVFATTITMTPAPSLTPTRESSPIPMPYPTELTQKGAKMALIPAGTFTMGSDKSDDDEKPPHLVSLAAFYMDKYEVTNMLYKVCVDAKVCQPPADTSSYTRPIYYGNSQFDNYPVIYVDWYDAKTYCEWRGARLPTEVEWEYTARGTDERTYPWGERIDCGKANYGASCKGDTTPVGSYESGKSPFGVYDMAGNVWEWAADWRGENYYATLGQNVFNPLGPSSGQKRVLRGGSWSEDALTIRSAKRFGYAPDFTSIYIGFRCALTP